jgi:hypothetical protein
MPQPWYSPRVAALKVPAGGVPWLFAISPQQAMVASVRIAQLMKRSESRLPTTAPDGAAAMEAPAFPVGGAAE